MRRINLLMFAITLCAGGVLHAGNPASAAATVAPSSLQGSYCCERGQMKCCGSNWCAILESGCARG
jgi:hypothetical protein